MNNKIKNSILLNTLLLTCLFNLNSLHAASAIDHVNTATDGDKEIITIVFNRPVQYLYHTPKSATTTMLLGFHIQHNKQKSISRHRPVSFRRAQLLQTIEIFYEQGFNPHLYLEFSSPVDVSVKPTEDLRGFILTISRQDRQ